MLLIPCGGNNVRNEGGKGRCKRAQIFFENLRPFTPSQQIISSTIPLAYTHQDARARFLFLLLHKKELVPPPLLSLPYDDE
jgi:hypothetical protein